MGLVRDVGPGGGVGRVAVGRDVGSGSGAAAGGFSRVAGVGAPAVAVARQECRISLWCVRW